MREAIKQTLIAHGVTDISGALLDELAAKQADAVRDALEAIVSINDPAGDASKHGFTGLATAKRIARAQLKEPTHD